MIKINKDIIVNFYKDKHSKKEIVDLSRIQNSLELNLITLNIGIGDAVIMTALTNQNYKNLNIYSNNKHWQTICDFNQKLNRLQTSSEYIRTELLEFVNIGNGHLAQRLQRALGLPIDLLPKPYLNFNKVTKKNKIGLHFSTGPSAFDLLEKGYKNPRQLEEKTKIEIFNFIKSSNYEFVEFGRDRIFKHPNVKNFTNKNIKDSIIELSECEYFIGLNSGFMNLAAGLSIKSIIILNVPDIKNVYIPVLKEYGEDDTNWLYPQNVHLHQNGENDLVKSSTELNIKKAINGEIYPYWENSFLDLIYDPFTS
jgi:hypothetical protein